MKETALDTLDLAEEALGSSLHWLADALDLRIRQGDKETIERLAKLNAAWVAICKLRHSLRNTKV